MRIVGVDSKAGPLGKQPLTSYSNYYIGNDPSKWRDSVARSAPPTSLSTMPMRWFPSERSTRPRKGAPPREPPQPSIIPVDGSTITVYIDNAVVGHPTYNQPRPDVSSLFPNLRNSGGPVGYYMIDTTRLANGLHTIAWVATDRKNNASGLGRRYFIVQN